MLKKIKQYFFTGIATIFPIVITFYILLFIFNFADNLLGKFINAYLVKNFGYRIPGLGIVIGMILIIAVGVLANHIIGKRLVPFLEKHFMRVPFVRHIYLPAKQLSDFLFKDKERFGGFKKVVLAEYPNEGLYSMGFVTNESIAEFNQKLGVDTIAVLIPTSPSPFSGPLVVLPREKVIPLDMPMEDAIKFVISGGLATPR